MMQGHVSPEAVQRYRSRSLPPDELLQMTSHLASCEECRKLVSVAPAPRLIAALGFDHFTFEQLERLASGGLGAETIDEQGHLTSCAMCAAELADLRAFRESLKPRTQGRRWRLLVPVAAFATAAAVFVAVRYTAPRQKPAVAQQQAARPALIASVRDRGSVIGLDAAGALRGLVNLGAADREAVASALRSGALPAAADLRDVRRATETQLSGEAIAKTILAPAGPIGSVVLSDRPTFHWTAPDGATGLRIAVFDTDFNEVAAGPVLGSKDWQPARPLTRGKVYIWTVTATVRGETFTAPKAPQPEARFRVASKEDAAVLNALAGQSDLAFALAAWKRGMKEEARAAMGELRAANPGSAELKRLSESMAARRQP